LTASLSLQCGFLHISEFSGIIHEGEQEKHSSGTSSGWLKAIPQPSLGLAFSPHDFVIAILLWLGVPLFPLLPLCACLSVIDQFGDHLLGCSHGPLRIQRHNALVSVVHQALLQDHPGVLREQSIASDHSRPGDIYHPDFALGRPTYFDLSVRCTTYFLCCVSGWSSCCRR